MDHFDDELKRTAYQRKAVSRLPPAAVLDLAIAFFKEREYRAGRTGRPNQVFIMGKAEGGLHRTRRRGAVAREPGEHHHGVIRELG